MNRGGSNYYLLLLGCVFLTVALVAIVLLSVVYAPERGKDVLPMWDILAYHTVQPGETILCIARAYGVDPQAIVIANGISDPSGSLEASRVLAIPNSPKALPPGRVCPRQFDGSKPSGVPLGELVVVIEWPKSMNYECSDRVTVTVIRADSGDHTPTVEVIRHERRAESLSPIGTPDATAEKAFGEDYTGSLTAGLAGSAFAVDSATNEVQPLNRSKIEWAWNIMPKSPGWQIVDVRMGGQWDSFEGSGPSIEREIWHASLEIRVKKPCIKRGQISLLGVASGLAASGLWASWIYQRIQQHRAKRREEAEDQPRIYLP